MNVLITGDRALFNKAEFEERLKRGLDRLSLTTGAISHVVRTAYGGAELRAQEFAHKYGIGIVQITPPEGYGKLARFLGMDSAVARSDVAIIFGANEPCEHIAHTIKAVERAEIPHVVV